MIARKTARELWPMVLLYFIAMEALLIPAITLWPELRELSEKVRPVLSLMQWMGKSVFRDVLQAAGNYSDYFALQAFFKGANICGAAAAVLIGTGLIARERENATWEFLASRPISPSRILLGKFSVAALGVVLPIFAVAWLSVPLSQWLVEESLDYGAVTHAAWHSSLFVLCMLALTTLCSSLFRLQAHVAAVAGVIIVSQVTLFFIQTAREYSLFQLSDIDVYGPILNGQLPFAHLFFDMQVWMLAAIAVMYLVTDQVLRRSKL